MQIRGLKKLGALTVVAMLSVLSVGTTAFASSQLYVSEEGVGIEVHGPSVLGGTLWTTWRNGTSYRANYDHASKTHRCTAENGNGVRSRSEWRSKGTTARSAFIAQTLVNNKSYAKTK